MLDWQVRDLNNARNADHNTLSLDAWGKGYVARASQWHVCPLFVTEISLQDTVQWDAKIRQLSYLGEGNHSTVLDEKGLFLYLCCFKVFEACLQWTTEEKRAVIMTVVWSRFIKSAKSSVKFWREKESRNLLSKNSVWEGNGLCEMGPDIKTVEEIKKI